jgi:hypothetical protein
MTLGKTKPPSSSHVSATNAQGLVIDKAICGTGKMSSLWRVIKHNTLEHSYTAGVSSSSMQASLSFNFKSFGYFENLFMPEIRYAIKRHES